MTTAPLSESVTVVVSRHVKRGREQDYEAWLDRLVQNASTLDGYLGARLQKPQPGAPLVYTSVFRFATLDTLEAFERSELRRQALAEVAPLVEADAVFSRWTGFELWFSPPKGTVVPQASRFRMALVMVVVVYALVMSLGRVVSLVIGGAPPALRLLVTIVLEVFFMTYVLMPRLTRWLARWIYPRKETV